MTEKSGSSTEPNPTKPVPIVERCIAICNEGISGKSIVDVERLNEIKDMLIVLVGFVEDVASEKEKDPVMRAKILVDLLGLQHD